VGFVLYFCLDMSIRSWGCCFDCGEGGIVFFSGGIVGVVEALEDEFLDSVLEVC
jgi:hypothetical protein